MRKKALRVRSVGLIIDGVVVLVENVPLRKEARIYTGKKYLTKSADMYFHVKVKGRYIHIGGVTLPRDKTTWIGGGFLIKDVITRETYRKIAADLRRHVMRILDTKSLEFKV